MKRLLALATVFLLLGTLPALAQETEPLDLSKLSYAQVIVKSGMLNARKKPDGKVQFRIPKDSIVMVSDEEGSWSEVVYDFQTGWVKTEFLDFEIKLGLEALQKDDNSNAVEDLKYRLQELCYFRSTAGMFDTYYTEVMSQRIKLVQRNLGLKEDGKVSAELHAYLYYGPMKKFRGNLDDIDFEKEFGEKEDVDIAVSEEEPVQEGEGNEEGVDGEV